MTSENVKKVQKDSAVLNFNSDREDEFLDTVRTLDLDTHWEVVSTPSISIHALTGAESEFFFSDCELDDVFDLMENTEANTGLYLSVDGQNYLLGLSAVKSLQDRAQISGAGLSKLSGDDYASVLNTLLQNQVNQSRIMTRAGKIRFVASGDSKDYAVLPMSELIDQTYAYLHDHFGDTEFVGGDFEHTMTTAMWMLPDMSSELLSVYDKAAKASGLNDAGHLVPAIKFSSSDTGISAVSLSAMLMGGAFPVFIGSAQKVNHRYGATIDNDYVPALEGLYASFRKQVEQLADLTKIMLSYPVNALTRLAKKYHLPKPETAEVVANYRMAFGDDPGTAHDVYMGLQEILFLNASNEDKAMKPRQRTVVEEDVAKCLAMTPHTWANFDLAEGVEI